MKVSQEVRNGNIRRFLLGFQGKYQSRAKKYTVFTNTGLEQPNANWEKRMGCLPAVLEKCIASRVLCFPHPPPYISFGAPIAT